MTFLGMISSGAVGWAVGKVAEVVVAPLGDLAKDINLRLAVTSALERAGKRLPEVFSEDEQLSLAGILRENHAVLFTVILERLKKPASSDALRGGMSAELAGAMGQSVTGGGDLISRFTDIIDEELWRKPPLVAHRLVLSQYFNEQNLASLVERLAPDISPAAIAARVRYAAARDNTKRMQTTGSVLERCVINLDKDGEQAPERLRSLIEKLRVGWSAALIDQGGAGKSTALLSVCELVRSATPDTAAVYLPMSDIARSASVFEALLRREAYISESVSISDLATQSRAAKLVFAFDGWNELSVTDRRAARQVIEAFRIDYPDAPVLLATRPYWSPLPVVVEESFKLDRISQDDQAAFVTELAGQRGLEALVAARDNRELSEILGIPFFLNLFARLPWSQDVIHLPANRVDLVARFVDAEFQRPVYLDPPPGGAPGFVRAVLTDIAVWMVRAGAVEIPTQAAAQIVKDHLSVAGFMHETDHVEAVLQRLSQQSLVHLAEDGGQRILIYDHQLLRDWFASFHVFNEISACGSDSVTPCSAVVEFGNARDWEGALGIAVETLGQGPEVAAGLRRFLLEMCGVDPSFASTLLASVGDHVWNSLSTDIDTFVDRWQAGGEGA